MRADAFVMCVFLAVISVTCLGGRSATIVLALTVLAAFLPGAIAPWHDNLSTGIDNGSVIAIPLVVLGMFGFSNVMRGNRALAEARAELARLRGLRTSGRGSPAISTISSVIRSRRSRSRPVLPAGSGPPILPALCRRSPRSKYLRGVRSPMCVPQSPITREVTLAGELATGRELLRAAGVAADLPRAVDVVDPEYHELFGWVVREGLTNLVRHADAGTCVVKLARASVEIRDDGVGGVSTSGSGLLGLHERVKAAGGVLDAGPVPPKGWRLSVNMQPDPGAPG